MTISEFKKKYPRSIGNLCWNCSRCNSCNMNHTDRCDAFIDVNEDINCNSTPHREENSINLMKNYKIDMEESLHTAHVTLYAMTKFMTFRGF